MQGAGSSFGPGVPQRGLPVGREPRRPRVRPEWKPASASGCLHIVCGSACSDDDCDSDDCRSEFSENDFDPKSSVSGSAAVHGLGQPQEQGARFEQTKTAATKRMRLKQAKTAATKKRLKPTPSVAPSSKFFGVGWHKGRKKWRAFVRHNGKLVDLGDSFDTELAAAKAVDVWLRANGRAAEAKSGSFVPESRRSPPSTAASAGARATTSGTHRSKSGRRSTSATSTTSRRRPRRTTFAARQHGYPTNFDESGVEIDYGSDAVLQAQAAQAAARDAEIVRKAADAAARAVAGNLTKCRRALIESVPSAAVEMLTAAAPKVAKQEEAREEVDEKVRRNGWCLRSRRCSSR